MGIAGTAVVRLAIRTTGREVPGGEAAATNLEFVALASTLPGDQLPVAVRETLTGELLEVALDDAYPLIREPAALRIRLWVSVWPPRHLTASRPHSPAAEAGCNDVSSERP